NEKKFSSRLKRGGQSEHVALDFDIAADTEYFDRECIRSVFNLAIEALSQECARLGKEKHFRLFERHDLNEAPSTYDQLAAEFALSTTDITNYLSWARRRFRQIVLDLREQVDPL